MTNLSLIKLDDNMCKAKCDHILKSYSDAEEQFLKGPSVFLDISSGFDNITDGSSTKKSKSYKSLDQKFNPKSCIIHRFLDFQDLENFSKNTSNISYDLAMSRKAFKRFLIKNVDNPKYNERYVAFVHGKYQGVGDDQTALILKMREKFGHVSMHVSLITKNPRVYFIG